MNPLNCEWRTWEARLLKSETEGFMDSTGTIMQCGITASQAERYSRQMLLPEVGEEGQLKLLRSKVLLVGAGGLGSPTAIYLAAGGIGTLGIIDFDRVALSNIHRQILHGTPDVGRPKTDSAVEMLHHINPEATIIPYQEKLTSQNALDLVRCYDMVVDGSDNIETKYLLNDAAFFAEKPYIFGGISGFRGQVSVFHPSGGGPCLRCMVPHTPPHGKASIPSEPGVFGIVPGQIGLIQAGEVFKLILGVGKPLVGRFLVYDYLPTRFKTLSVPRNHECPLCGDNPSIKDLSGHCEV